MKWIGTQAANGRVKRILRAVLKNREKEMRALMRRHEKERRETEKALRKVSVSAVNSNRFGR